MNEKVRIGDTVKTPEQELANIMDLMHSEVKEITMLLLAHRENDFDRDTYLGLKALIDAKLEINTRVYVLISAIVLAKADIDKLLRTNPNYALSNRFISNLKELSEYLGAYKSISYSIGAEIQVIKELIYVKHPELRQRY